jgi:hypothetical protein
MRDIAKLNLDLNKPESFGNLAEKLDDSDRRILATDLAELINIDEQSMSDWTGEAEGYLDKIEDADKGNAQPQNREQEGAGEEPAPSTELTLSAVIQFSARATDALLGEPDLARASEPGGEKLAAWVSSQLRTKDPNWVLDTDPLIVHMSVTGLAWRKRSFDDIDKVFHSYFLPSVGPGRVIVNKSIRSIERAPRITHDFERYPYEIERSIERGHWIDYEPRYDERDTQAPKKFYEVDLWLDLDGDEIDEPWTITISRDDFLEVIKIAPRWSKKTIVDTKDVLFFRPFHRFYPYRFLPDPKGGFLPIGFGKLLHRIESSADHLLASICDTAQTEGENGGVLAGGGVGLPDKVELKGNRVTTINTDGRPLQDMFSPFPMKSVSPGSVQVLEKMMTLGDRLAGTLNNLENAPASMTATMAKGLIDSGSQVQSAVHRRLVSSLTQEMHQFVQMADAYGALPEGVTAQDGNGVAVTADPQLATEMARSAAGGLYMQMIEAGAKVPGSFNVQEAASRFCQVMRLPDPEKLIGQPPPPPQATPWEKMQGAVKLMRERTENIKVTGAVAVQLTQALLNMVEAAGGMQNNRAALLTMAQLEQAVQQMMQGAADAGTSLDGVVNQQGDQGSQGVPPPAASGAPPPVSNGAGSGAAGPGAGSGLQ